jgi:putative ABC transport system ATP-binding protein
MPESEVRAESNGYLIRTENLWKTYEMGAEKIHALAGVSFLVRRNEYLAIMGPSGSGKSTLMNLIGCLDTPTQGKYWINSRLVSDMNDDELAYIRNGKSVSSFRLSICWLVPQLFIMSSSR